MKTLSDIERETILSRLRLHGGDRTATAASLGIGRRTLQNKLNAWGIVPAKPGRRRAAQRR